MLQKIAVAAVVAFVLLGAVIFYLNQQQASQPVEDEFEPDFGETPGIVVSLGNPAPVPGNCPNLESSYDRDLCWSFQAGEEKNVRLCDNIVGEARNAICIEEVARQLFDKSICEQEFPSNVDRKYHCITQLAREQAEYTLCNQMPSPYKEKCAYAVGEELIGTVI
ncbi:MAG: hypothetical protein JW744_02455 [Candidatus Diapherotrites archaeon]|uniref:Uncharacterized protein n=1 Tax=Candidatus Iainarchaeum sp. TaxID=3101447 RepID=A0A938YUC3_9ARCH|nr:hypothetical protein [Candidatus Diapherotrites archaeon]